MRRPLESIKKNNNNYLIFNILNFNIKLIKLIYRLNKVYYNESFNNYVTYDFCKLAIERNKMVLPLYFEKELKRS